MPTVVTTRIVSRSERSGNVESGIGPQPTDSAAHATARASETTRTLRFLPDQQARRPHGDDPGEEPADRPARPEPSGGGAGDVAPHLDDHLERRAGRDAEEERCENVVGGVPAEPGAEDRGRS